MLVLGRVQESVKFLLKLWAPGDVIDHVDKLLVSGCEDLGILYVQRFVVVLDNFWLVFSWRLLETHQVSDQFPEWSLKELVWLGQNFFRHVATVQELAECVAEVVAIVV